MSPTLRFSSLTISLEFTGVQVVEGMIHKLEVQQAKEQAKRQREAEMEAAKQQRLQERQQRQQKKQR